MYIRNHLNLNTPKFLRAPGTWRLSETETHCICNTSQRAILHRCSSKLLLGPQKSYCPIDEYNPRTTYMLQMCIFYRNSFLSYISYGISMHMSMSGLDHTNFIISHQFITIHKLCDFAKKLCIRIFFSVRERERES